ncbi:hypothetical protein [Brevundimonas fluminis]|uniref:hypothetical protein n=1 Tax=Brevundimonas fluminis TaxID=2487274 RepID=UPI000F658D8D|nr:hypothetical protein [Brevundimonas fluminis]
MAGENQTFGLRYVGARFHDARLPVDVLFDLPAFRDLLVSFAKAEWRAANREKQRLPRGFDKSFSFDLIAIEEGSAVPKLEWNRETAQANLPGLTDQLSEVVDRAYKRVLDLVEAAGNDNFPVALSSEQVRALNKFGAGLRDGEKIEFQGSADNEGEVIFLDTERRKRIITHTRGSYRSRYEGIGRLLGSVINADGIGGHIRVETEQHGEIAIALDAERVEFEFDGSMNAQVQFDLMIELDNNDVFKGVVDSFDVDLIDEEIVADLLKRRERLAELRKLEDGWYDGEGLGVSEAADQAAQRLLDKRPLFAAHYLIFPTVAGGILFEIEQNGWDYSVEIAADGSVEMFGVQIDGPDEMEPQNFDGINDAFVEVFDAKLAEQGANG